MLKTTGCQSKVEPGKCYSNNGTPVAFSRVLVVTKIVHLSYTECLITYELADDSKTAQNIRELEDFNSIYVDQVSCSLYTASQVETRLANLENTIKNLLEKLKIK